MQNHSRPGFWHNINYKWITTVFGTLPPGILFLHCLYIPLLLAQCKLWLDILNYITLFHLNLTLYNISFNIFGPSLLLMPSRLLLHPLLLRIYWAVISNIANFPACTIGHWHPLALLSLWSALNEP